MLGLLLRLLFYCGTSFVLDYFVGEVRLEVQSCVYLRYWFGTSILCIRSCIRPGNGSGDHSGNSDRLHGSCHSGCDDNGH